MVQNHFLMKKDAKEKKDKRIIEAINHSLKIAFNSKLYKNKFRKLLSVSKLKGIHEIPLTTKKDLRDSYPYGNLAIDFSKVIEMHTSSGTTGKPTLSFYTKKDLEMGSKAISKAWVNFGINNKSRVQFMMSYGLFSGAMLNTYAIQSLGAFVLPSGIQPTAKQVQLLQEFDIDTMVATPSYYLHLYDYLIQNNIPIKSLKLKRGIAAGEVYSDEMKKKISELFCIKIYDHYGLCEVNTGIVYECKKCGGMAVLDDYVYPEIIDPINGELLKERQNGELVLTSLHKEASPIIRYRTGDVTSIKTFFSKCSNCYGSVILDRIKARCDSTIFYKGLKLEPFELRDMIILFMGDKMYNRIKIQIYDDLFKNKPKILLSLKSCENNKSILCSLQDYLKEKTGATFLIEEVPYSYFGDITSTKEKIVEYVDKK